MFTSPTVYRADAPRPKELGDNLVLRSVSDEQDVERLAGFNGHIHGPGAGAAARELILRHPHTRPEHWLFVEDTATGQVVSSICLISWTLRYSDGPSAGVQLKAGEMGFVGTLKDYRHRGLVRALNGRFSELLQEGEYDLSHIQGIPYFYRQFGYEYAMPLEGGWHVQLHQIPHLATDEPDPRHTFRLATSDVSIREGDLPALARLYEEAAQDLNISAVRSEGEWRYLLGPSLKTEMCAETWLVVEAGRPVGYVRVPEHGFGEGLIVNEASRMGREAALSTLCHLKTLSDERNKPYIRLCLPQGNALIQVARTLGAHDAGRYAWQVRLLDVARLLRKLASVFERRVASSPLAGATQTVCLNLYREAFELKFERGRLAEVSDEPHPTAVGFRDGSNIRIPPLLLAPLLLGYRSREELAQAHHDFSAWGEGQMWVDVLFPKMSSFIYTIY